MCNWQNPGNFFNKCYSSSDIPYKIFWHRHPINYVLWYIYSPEKKIKNTQLFMNQLLSTGSEYKDLEYLNFLPCNSQLNKTEKQSSTFPSWTSHLPFSTTLDAVLSSSPMNGWMAIETAFFVSRCISVIAISISMRCGVPKRRKEWSNQGDNTAKTKVSTLLTHPLPCQSAQSVDPLPLHRWHCFTDDVCGTGWHFTSEVKGWLGRISSCHGSGAGPMSEPSTSSPR